MGCGTIKPPLTLAERQDALKTVVHNDLQRVQGGDAFLMQLQLEAIGQALDAHYGDRTEFVDAQAMLHNLLDPEQRQYVVNRIIYDEKLRPLSGDKPLGPLHALDVVVQLIGVYKAASLSDIINAFVWHNTPEGHRYWLDIRRQVLAVERAIQSGGVPE